MMARVSGMTQNPGHLPVMFTQAMEGLRVLKDGRYLDGHSGRSDIKIFIRVNSFQTGEMDENTYLKDEGEDPKQSNLLTNVIKCV